MAMAGRAGRGSMAGLVGLGLGLGACAAVPTGLGGGDGDGTSGAGGSTTAGDRELETDGATATAGATSVGTGGLDASGSGSDPGMGVTTGSGSSGEPGEESTTGEPPVGLCEAASTLAACYDFEDVGAGMLLDKSGNGNDAEATNVGVVPGPFGDAAIFDGRSRISVPDSPSLDISGSLAVEAWIRVEALPGSGRMGVLDNDGQYGLMIHADDRYRCSLLGTTVEAQGVVVGTWSHLACVYDGGALRLYVDGAQVGSVDVTGSIATGNDQPMSIGDTSPDFNEPLLGAIGGLRVWSEARSAEQLCEAAGDLCGD